MKEGNQSTNGKLDLLFEFTESVGFPTFNTYIEHYICTRNDREKAIQELDKQIGNLQNWALSLACYFKQNYLFRNDPETQTTNSVSYFTKHEIANKYRVSIRTVNNWIISGLNTIEIGGVVRVSNEAISEFVRHNRTKKFNWKSPKRH